MCLTSGPWAGLHQHITDMGRHVETNVQTVTGTSDMLPRGCHAHKIARSGHEGIELVWYGRTQKQHVRYSDSFAVCVNSALHIVEANCLQTV